MYVCIYIYIYMYVHIHIYIYIYMARPHGDDPLRAEGGAERRELPGPDIIECIIE